jgi:hypothetical protein
MREEWPSTARRYVGRHDERGLTRIRSATPNAFGVRCIAWLSVSDLRTSISDNHKRNVWDKVKHNHDDFEEA